MTRAIAWTRVSSKGQDDGVRQLVDLPAKLTTLRRFILTTLRRCNLTTYSLEFLERLSPCLD